jgi:uncharacterized protein
VLEHLRRARERRKAQWEGLCRRCGLCCYEKDVRGLRVETIWTRPCRFLNVATRECTVYAERFQRCPECRRMTLRHALFVPWLPERCGYVSHFRPWLRPWRMRRRA